MFVKKQIRQNLVNSRKKLIFAILDNTGVKDFSLQGFTPDVSLFRTMFLNTNLYKQDDNYNSKGWRFADPEEIKDKGLSDVWGIIKNFFTEPSENEKSILVLFNKLMAPPYGLRRALLPVLFSAGLKAFPSFITITFKDEYLKDILPSNIEDIFKNPESFKIRVFN